MSSENPPTACNTTITVPVGWQTRRTLDPIRAAALHEAVQFVAAKNKPGTLHVDEYLGQLLASADMFEAWLQGAQAFDLWLAEDNSE